MARGFSRARRIANSGGHFGTWESLGACQSSVKPPSVSVHAKYMPAKRENHLQQHHRPSAEIFLALGLELVVPQLMLPPDRLSREMKIASYHV